MKSTHDDHSPTATFLRRVAESLHRHGARVTEQRLAVARALFEHRDHVSPQELHDRLRHLDVGEATVYRTLALLARLGLATRYHFGDGVARYEPGTASPPHAHLVCTECDSVHEFEHEALARIEEFASRRLGFTVVQLRVELAGSCRTCRAGLA